VSVGSGDFEKVMASARYGSSFGEESHWRIYAKHQAWDEFKNVASSKDVGDNWQMTQASFRIDSTLTTKDKLTFQGDFYEGNINQKLYLVDFTQSPYMTVFPVEVPVSGGNLLTRWQHTLSSTSDFSLQIYYEPQNVSKTLSTKNEITLTLNFSIALLPEPAMT
jgi:iron complex outermembrane receptor protein